MEAFCQYKNERATAPPHEMNADVYLDEDLLFVREGESCSTGSALDCQFLIQAIDK